MTTQMPIRSDIVRGKTGFTIVELLIVVVVIAILAAITVVSFNGIQQQARDTKRIDDVNKIVKAFQIWSIQENSNFTTMQAGSGAAEVGWFDGPYTPYPSVKSVLVSGGYLSEGVVDPINDKTVANASAYMITFCNGEENTRVILARLENPPVQTVAEQIGKTCTYGSFTSYVGTYQMNYGRLIEL